MEVEYVNNFSGTDLFKALLLEVVWEERGAPRQEYFMSLQPLEYTYGVGRGQRKYSSSPFHSTVKDLMDKLNKEYDCDYNVCFLNYYKDERQHLGWHADNSPEMDSSHPISVISFGEEREIWWREIGFKGAVPDSNKKLLRNCSLFIMPPGFQEKFEHRIPKASRQGIGGRISLTFRRYRE